MVENQEVLEQPVETEQVEQAQEIQSQPQERPQEKNFRELREKAERIEKERDLALQRLQEYEASKQQQPQPDYQLRDDDLVEGKHLSKYDQKIKALEEQISQYSQKASEAAIENRIKSQYTDFDKIVTEDSIKMLRELYPEIADTINSTPNLYNKAVSAYTMIKKLGVVPEDNYSQDRSTAQRNASKPRPTSSIAPQQGDTPLSRANAFANGLNDELKAQLRKEMEEARRGY